MQERKHTLVATLGGQPQIVTFTLDLLLQRSIPIYEVIVVHPASSPRLQQSLERLNAEFVGDRYAFEGRSLIIHFHQQVLSRYETIIDDIVNETTASGALDTIGEMIRDLKQQRRIIHFSISGGQRLIEVPFARAAQPVLASMLNRPPSATIQTYHEQRKAEEQKRCKQVVDTLKGKPLQVLQALAQGMHPNEVATALNIKPSTISTYTNPIYQTCRNSWNLPDNVQVNYLFVQARFADYFPNDKSITYSRKKDIQTSLEKNRN